MNVIVRIDNPVRAFKLQPEQLSALRERFPELQFSLAESPQAVLQALPTVHAALVWRFDAEWYAQAPHLKLVATPAAGRERVMPDPTGRVRTVHGAFHGKVMAESLIGMMLYWSRRFDVALQNKKNRRWERDAFSTTWRLSGQTAVIVGYGPLGRECALKLKAFDMKVVGIKRQPGSDAGPADAVLPASMLHSALGQADHVIVTLPSDTGTDHVFDDQAFQAMRRSACFYNIGRGNAVSEAALVRALEARTISAAFLDVFEKEPLPPESPLWTAPNLEFLPHASAISREYLDLWIEEIAPELARLR